ncbi:GtrA family protein [Caproiciproducens galactitolivorans]|uniref:GtrA-like protein n=1 Tax=Caproiciproducens galactitolivorans TaxID=642589 RepID=A0A4Z0XY99_9FIRM|nr:GtrA family protein [Caproiciproducens galactitolivorans]QEY34904.1 GtrA family protein [Caproiciproducens galactitolivorans]TGJ76394.1 GtrA-like protein [Caproiciproducens galactitolivorans]
MDKLKKLWRFLTTPEMISYIVFGVLTTIVNIVSYGLLRPVIHWNSQWDVLTANTIAWILSVAFAFITNKLYVFQSKSFAAGLLMRELASFVGARLFSLAVDSLGMYLMVTVLSWNDWIAKIIMNVIVVIINYVLSKWFIFKK